MVRGSRQKFQLPRNLQNCAIARQSQLSKILDEGTVKVAIQDDSAYWVIDNILYKCDITKDGKIHNENAEKVDVFNLSEKEVNNLLCIIDSINS